MIGVITRGDLVRVGLSPGRFDTPRLTLSQAAQPQSPEVADEDDADDDDDDSGADAFAEDTLP